MKKVVLLNLVVVGLLGVMCPVYGLETTATNVLAVKMAEVDALRKARDQKFDDLLTQIQKMLQYLKKPNAKELMGANNYTQAIKLLDDAINSLLKHVGGLSVRELALVESKVLQAGPIIAYTPELIR